MMVDKQVLNTGCLRHRTQRPMRCFMGWWGLCQPHNLGHAISRDRRDTGRAGLVAKQAIDALRHEPLLPAPDASLRLARRSPDRHRTQPIIAQQNDMSTPDMFLQASGSGHNRLQSQAISQRSREGNTSSHPSESHILGAVGIPNQTLLTQPIH